MKITGNFQAKKPRVKKKANKTKNIHIYISYYLHNIYFCIVNKLAEREYYEKTFDPGCRNRRYHYGQQDEEAVIKG